MGGYRLACRGRLWGALSIFRCASAMLSCFPREPSTLCVVASLDIDSFRKSAVIILAKTGVIILKINSMKYLK